MFRFIQIMQLFQMFPFYLWLSESKYSRIADQKDPASQHRKPSYPSVLMAGDTSSAPLVSPC